MTNQSNTPNLPPEQEAEDWPVPTKENLLAVAAYADPIEQEQVAQWPKSTDLGDGRRIMPVLVYGEALEQLNHLVYKTNMLVTTFDWGEWIPEAEAFMVDFEAVAVADLVTIQKLITAHFRGDRFTEGHLASIHESGHLVAILRRVGQLAEEMN